MQLKHILCIAFLISIPSIAMRKELTPTQKKLQQKQQQKQSQQQLDKVLLIACMSENTDTINNLIQKGANVNYKHEEQISPLHIACESGRLDVVKLLIQAGADKDAKTMGGETPLYFASQNGHEKVVEFLCNSGANVNSKTNRQISPLHIASEHGHLNIVKILLTAKAEKNAQDNQGATPLYYACQFNHPDIVEYLCNSGVDISIGETPTGSTPLHLACQEGYLKIAEILVKYHANTETQTLHLKWTPLHFACSYNHPELVNFLIANHANIHITDRDKWTPLDFAIYYANSPEIVTMLLEHGAQVNTEADHGVTPVHLAFYKQNPAIIDLLVKYGAHIISDKQAEEAEQQFLAQLNQEEPHILITPTNTNEDECQMHPDALECAINNNNIVQTDKPIIVIEQSQPVQPKLLEIKESKEKTSIANAPTSKSFKSKNTRTKKTFPIQEYPSKAQNVTSEKVSSSPSKKNNYQILPFKWGKFLKTNQLSETQQNAIKTGINQLKNWGETSDLDSEKLQGKKDTFRVRVGEYRITFFVNKKNHQITILDITLRGDAYKK
jgi:ankyrin repeat protein/mRNA-degrading endonuclease RelE of RelBE toxin-antitoxin system